MSAPPPPPHPIDNKENTPPNDDPAKSGPAPASIISRAATTTAAAAPTTASEAPASRVPHAHTTTTATTATASADSTAAATASSSPASAIPPPVPPKSLQSNNPFLKQRPVPLISDSVAKEFPYKSLNRIINDLKWTIPYREYLASMGINSSASGSIGSLLNSKSIDYAKNLSYLSKTYARNRFDCLILNNSLKYAPALEVFDDLPGDDNRVLTVVRGLLVNRADKSADVGRSGQIYHFQISILEIKPAPGAIATPVDKREYHIIPQSMVPETAQKLLRNDPDYTTATPSTATTGAPHVIDDSYFKAANSPSDHLLRVTIFDQEFSSEHDILPIVDQDVIRARYLESITKFPQANLSPESVPTAINCFNTLLKVLRGPLLIGPNDQIKTINLNNPSLNSQIDINLLFNKLSFTIDDSELTPPNLLQNIALRESYIRKILEIIYIAHNLPAEHGNDFATSVSFSDNLSLVYRTFNEVNQHLCSSFGGNDIDNNLRFMIELNVCSFFQDEMIIKCFESTWKSDKQNKLEYVDALKDLIQFRTSSSNIRTSKLNTYYTSNHLYGKHDYFDALKAVGIVDVDGNTSNSIDDDFITAMYLTTFKSDPKNYMYFNKKLRLINEIRGSPVIQKFLDEEILPLNIALEELNIEEVTEDEVVITAYEFKKEDLLSSDDIKFLNKALLSVAVNRKSYLLMNYIEENLGELLTTTTTATRSLTTAECYDNLDSAPTANDFELILAFQKKLLDTNSDIRNLRQYLKTILETRKSKLLERFLSTGTIDVALLPAENWPAGLDNIGNTCYLNSLLQYYFCLKPLRDMVLDFDEEAQSDGESVRKIGGRTVEQSETIRSNQFIYHLKKLFNDMIHSEKRCVQPSKELAFLAFLPSSQPVTFMDQETKSNAEPITDDLPDDIEILDENDINPIIVPSQTPSPPPAAPSAGDDDMDIDVIEVIEPVDDEFSEVSNEKLAEVKDDETTAASEVVRKTLAISSDIMDSTIEMGRQQDVTECIENVTFQVEAALKPDRIEDDGEQYDLIKKLFYGKTKQKITPLNPDSSNKERTSIERFSSLIINVSDHPKDIYDSLDNYFSEDLVKLEEGEVKKSLTICELPEILQFHVQRVLFDRERLMAYKSLEPIPFSEKIYVDRYLDTEDPEILRKRNEVFKWKYEINDLLAKKEALTKKEGGSQMTIVDTLVTAKRYLEGRLQEEQDKALEEEDTFKDDVEMESIDESGKEKEEAEAEEAPATVEAEEASPLPVPVDTLPSTIAAIEAKIAKLNQEIKDIDTSLVHLKKNVSDQFQDYNKVGYSIFAIFIHRGEASYGHYWIYIKDPKRNIFRKYNDEVVTEVPFSEVMNFEEGNTATPYYIVYVKESLEEKYIEPLKRVIPPPRAS